MSLTKFSFLQSCYFSVANKLIDRLAGDLGSGDCNLWGNMEYALECSLSYAWYGMKVKLVENLFSWLLALACM